MGREFSGPDGCSFVSIRGLERILWACFGVRVEINRRETAETGALQTEGEAAAAAEKIEEGENLPWVVRKHRLNRSRANQPCAVQEPSAVAANVRTDRLDICGAWPFPRRTSA